MSGSNNSTGGVGGVGGVSGSSGANAARAAADRAAAAVNDPARVADAMVDLARQPAGVNVDALGGMIAMARAADPAFAGAVQRQVEAQLSPVDVGRLQGAIAAQPSTMQQLTTPAALPNVAAPPTYSYNNAGQMIDACGHPVAELRATPAPVPAMPRTNALADLMCEMPAISLGTGVSAYAGPGGGVGVGMSYDPRTGVMGLDGNAEIGFGVGFKAGPEGRLTRSRDVERGATNAASFTGNDRGLAVGMGLSANVQAGPVAVRGETELVGTSMNKPLADRTKISTGLGAVGLGANVNVNVAASGSWQIAEPNCPVPLAEYQARMR